MKLDLESIYRETLRRCAPEHLVRGALPPNAPRTIVSIGKSAGALLDGVDDFDQAFVAIPEGYRLPSRRAGVAIHIGGHPQVTEASFAAGRALLDFVRAHHDLLFMISGGGSACVEVPLTPLFDERDVIDANARLLAAGLPIHSINTVRKHLSAIKGGRLAANVRGRIVTMVYSDVSSGALSDVASGPTLPDTSTIESAAAVAARAGLSDLWKRIRAEPETIKSLRGDVILIADNDTLTATAAEIATEHGAAVRRLDGQIESDAGSAADLLATQAKQLRPGEILISGGEVTVEILGAGRGGRCTELAVRFVRAASSAERQRISALFATSDGVDGNSGAAGILLDQVRPLPHDWEDALRTSDSLRVALALGRPVIIPTAGNNLRDLYLLARS